MASIFEHDATPTWIGFFGGGVKFYPENNLTIIQRQFCRVNHTPHEVMRLSFKKLKKVCDINLTYAGYGALCVEDSLLI